MTIIKLNGYDVHFKPNFNIPQDELKKITNNIIQQFMKEKYVLIALTKIKLMYSYALSIQLMKTNCPI